ncbi:MAG: class I SAM-dependent methyltransferase [Pseudomonadota bacterium]|nr:class I SAM-dependent methyltransferase [Pseudomonadota bacterium]
MLMRRDAAMALYCCPRTGMPLHKEGDRLVVEALEDGPRYDIVDGYPVLVDYERSVLEKSSVQRLSSVVARHDYGGWKARIKRLVSPPKDITADNVDHLLRLIRRDDRPAKVLVVGGGSRGQNMEPLYEDPRIELVAFDIYASPWVQFVADAHQIPLPSGYFDAVVIQAVLEHVLQPQQVVAEIYRVLKNNGVVYAETPFLQHVHEGAYDFTRFTESGHRFLFRHFDRIDSGFSAGAGTQLLWSLDNFSRGLSRSRFVSKLVKLVFFWLRYCDRWIPDAYNIDAASGVFFLGRKRAVAVDGRTIIAHYLGAQR